ncbi:rRNA methyltransferase 1, mitochondrial-like isoform X1 [Oratosquilla oratoria]|uniref:rRNA methyltransferase 1, mitochondrial-like isoform X1 n=1 Tax=Oratosquilla oratoria TaxID=337810 RepID=UPI003F76D730
MKYLPMLFTRNYSRKLLPVINFKYAQEMNKELKGDQKVTTEKSHKRNNNDCTVKESVYKEISGKESGDLLVSSDLLAGENGKFRETKNSKSCVTKEYLYGIHPVELALQCTLRKIHTLYYKEGIEKIPKNKNILKLAKEKNIPCSGVSKGKIDKLVGKGTTHQGICVHVDTLDFVPLTLKHIKEITSNMKHFQNVDRCETSQNNENPQTQLWLLLDSIHDPMNLGAILRSAYFFGVDRVLTLKENCCKLTSVVSKASSGVVELMPIYQLQDDILETLEVLREAGWTLAVTGSWQGTNVIPVQDLAARTNIMLCIGNEGYGVSEVLLRAIPTQVAVIPGRHLHPGMGSLNVSAATAAMLQALAIARLSQL